MNFIGIFFVLLWASGYIASVIGLQLSDPITFMTFRMLIAFLLFFILCLYRKNALTKDIVLNSSLAGIFLQFIYPVAFAYSLSDGMEPALLTIILGFQPILTLLISKDKMSSIQKCGILGCVIGTLIFSFDSFSIGGANMRNILFAFISLAGVTFGTILQKKRCSQYNLETNLMVQTGAALALFIICILIHGYHYSLSYSFVLSVLWQGILISFISSILLIKALARGSVTNISTYFSCVPAATAFFSFCILQSTISLSMLLGIVIIFISTYIVQNPSSLKHTKKIVKHE